MKLIQCTGSLIAVFAISACSSSSNDLNPFETTSVETTSAVASSSVTPTTARSAPRTTRQAGSFAEQFDQMTETSCKDDVSPAECMYERRAYLDFFERSAMQTLPSSYHENVNSMVEMLNGQHDEFVSKGCLSDPSSEDCAIPLMLSDTGMMALGVMFSAQ